MFHANVCLARAMARLFKILVRLKQHNSVTKIISQKFVDLVTSKAGAKAWPFVQQNCLWCLLPLSQFLNSCDSFCQGTQNWRLCNSLLWNGAQGWHHWKTDSCEKCVRAFKVLHFISSNSILIFYVQPESNT
jgi:hypothetical protein